jgi:hypothetical protein
LATKTLAAAICGGGTAGGLLTFFFASSQSPFETATMDDQVEFLVDSLEEFGRGQTSFAGSQLFDKGQDFFGKLVGLMRSPFLR